MTDEAAVPWEVPLPPLHQAAEDGDLSQAMSLLDADPTLISSAIEEGDQPLHLACWQGHADLVQLFIERGADVNARGDFGQTPLHYVMSESDFDGEAAPIVRLLLAAGADPTLREDRMKLSPLALALTAPREFAECIQLMRDHIDRA